MSVLELEPEEVVSIATDDFGVVNVDDANFKVMVKYLSEQYTKDELVNIARIENLHVRPSDTKKTLTRAILLSKLYEGMEYYYPNYHMVNPQTLN
jgi:hypothetical protein